jgi:uncharacterized membrane protein
VVTLSGLGVYLGRFLRLNSRDLLVRPGAVLDALASLDEPDGPVEPAGFTALFMILLLLSYWVFLSVRRAPRSREEEHLTREAR